MSSAKEEPEPKHGVYASGRSRPAPRKRMGAYYKQLRKLDGILKRSKKQGPKVEVEVSPSHRAALRRNRVGVAPKVKRACNMPKAEASIHTRQIWENGKMRTEWDPIVSMLHGK